MRRVTKTRLGAEEVRHGARRGDALVPDRVMRGLGSEGGDAPGPGTRTGSWWTVTRRACVGTAWEALTVGCGGEEALAVFSFRGEAELFVGLEGLGPQGWVARETSRGELASALCGPRAGVGGVALDPLPGVAGPDRTLLLGLLVVGREGFLERLLSDGGGGRTASRTGGKTSPARPAPRTPADGAP